MSPEEIARRWLEAVTFARSLRAVFGDGVRLIYARNAAGEELGSRSGSPMPAKFSKEPDSRVQSNRAA